MDNDIDYDLVIAGGSVAGAALGFAAKRAGARVLIAEAELGFRDRVRGEALHSWGIAEAARLGLIEVLEAAPAQAALYWDTYVGGTLVEHRNLAQTTPARLPGYNLHHPELQTALLEAAEGQGVTVQRGVKVSRIEPGRTVGLELSRGDERSRVRAHLAVIADGRQSPLRKQLGIDAEGQRSPLITSGVLLENVSMDPAAVGMFAQPASGALALAVPLPRGRTRLYLVEQASAGRRYSGQADFAAARARCEAIGVPPDALEDARVIGPLASFETTCWSLRERALPPGVALVGDAAGNVDPTFGCGQSLALRDARTLAEQLRECDDWQLAAARHAEQRRGYHAALLRLEGWLTRILFTPGAEGDALRSVTMPRLAELGIDLIGSGPDCPADAATEALLFAGTS
ncbi:MAG: NAD(P)/FAD-dependent oxidoreductase [Myxococcales bacterium]|jgi:2-polyprenyl-6-methoxyphenol hydroxylase-like FAD-dependent oxidoreductase